MKKILNNFIFTLSTFTKIPTPQIKYSKENTKYTFFFLPLVGIILGVINYYVYGIINEHIGEISIISLIMIFININITGGIHMDGYIDSLDAFKSYRSFEEKKRIIKDSCVGAFGLIHYISILIIYYIAYYYLIYYNLEMVFLIMPIISRMFILILVCNNSREENDMLDDLIGKTIKKWHIIIFTLYTIVVLTTSLFLYPGNNTYIVLGYLFGIALIYGFYYNRMFKEHFKALNGDLCGYYIVMSEALAPLALIIYTIIATGTN